MKKIKVKTFPFLADIMWQYDAEDLVEEEKIFKICEREWEWIDFNNLTNKEHVFLEKLKNEYGNGIFLHD